MSNAEGPKPEMMCRVAGSFHSGLAVSAGRPHCRALTASIRRRAGDLVVLSWRIHHSPSCRHCEEAGIPLKRETDWRTELRSGEAGAFPEQPATAGEQAH